MPTPAASPRDPVDEHFAAAYRDLRRVAHARLRSGGSNRVLDTTALVNETYLRLAGRAGVSFPDRARFLQYAAHAMRSIIVDLLRERARVRRGGEVVHVTLDEGLGHADGDAGQLEVLAVDQALDALARRDPRMASIVEMRYFAGMTDTEIGEALGVTDRTVRRDWEVARAFLAEALK